MADTNIGATTPPGDADREAILRRVFGEAYSPDPPQPKGIETEVDWLAANGASINELLFFLQPRVTRRKPLLLAVAGCRRIGHLIKDTRLKVLVDTAECFANGNASDRDIQNAAEAIGEQDSGDWNACCYTAVTELSEQLNSHPMGPANGVIKYAPMALCRVDIPITEPESRAIIDSEKAVLVNLIHDIFGNPFRPIILNPAWLTSTVVSLSKGIYSEKAFERMPILADALQEAGCDNEDILNHCRDESVHVRGCWVIDRLLGKE